MTPSNKFNIASAFESVFKTYATCDALFVGDCYYTYQQLRNQSNILRDLILKHSKSQVNFVGVFCDRSIDAYSGMVGVLLSGRAYMPLNPIHPPDKLRKFIEISECSIIILGEECADIFSKIESIDQDLVVICPNPGEKIDKLKANNKNIRVTYVFPSHSDELQQLDVEIFEDTSAYLMFTSGSTGEPKGIVVSHKNLSSYANYTISKYKIDSSDRVSQPVDISFDLSVHNIFTTLLAGASLYVLTRNDLIAPREFINRHRLTHWISVPSVAIAMSSMGFLAKNSLPSLKYTLFCGEGLPCNIAIEWQAAANNSVIENLYGPTEATVAFMSYSWNQVTSPSECFNGLVPIGLPFDGMEARIVPNDQDADSMSIGELYVSGDQVVMGYFKNETLTNERFVILDGDSSKLWYRTGDLVKRSGNGDYLFVGRNDDQLKIRGYRVELLEIDHVLREACGHQMAVCLPKVTGENFEVIEGVVGFVESSSIKQTKEDLINFCITKLPNYMVPLDIIFLEKMPLNVNGKIDKKFLRQSILEDVEGSNTFDKSNHELVMFDLSCSVCLKTLDEDKNLGGYGFIKIINHQQQDDYICHICLKGF
jgi:amino acid adenylation domain-containing protein